VKKIEAVIRPHKFDDVKLALHHAGVTGMTVSEVRGCGRQKGHSETYRGVEYSVDLLPKLKIEVVVADDRVDAATEAILRQAQTGQIGDGKIFISEIADCVRIRSGEMGVEAI
jgi:nitrogen regulatory protein P-II 1